MSAVTPPFAYFGGKTLLGPWIAHQLPAHRHYVEPFAGSLAVLLARQAPAPIETVNDIDGDVVTFWRVLREQPDELARVCALTPHSRAEHLAAYDRPEDLTDVERARRVWVLLSQGRMGTLLRSGWRHHVDPRSMSTSMPRYLLGYLDRIHAAADRLRAVSLECRPAVELIERYGEARDVLLYVDPPYLGETRGDGDDVSRTGTRRYVHDMLREDEHCELLDALLGCRAAVVLSGYASALYDQVLDGWHRVERQTGTGQSAHGVWSERTEVLWSNRPLARPATLWDEL